MIKRARRPDSGFLLIRNDVVRDRRLSYRARGLLCAMLSYPDDWEFNRDWLAGQSDGEGQAAVRTALQELERHGYLKRERIRVGKGKFGWRYVVYDTPQSAEGVFAGRSTGQVSTDGFPTAGFPPSKEQLSPTTEDEDGLECDHSGRFAPSVAAFTNEDHNDTGPTARVPAQRESEEFDYNWRDEDRELFIGLVGERLKSVGGKWKKGVWASKAFYDSYRKPGAKRKALQWPGRYLQGIVNNRDDVDAVEDWMISEGLERVE